MAKLDRHMRLKGTLLLSLFLLMGITLGVHSLSDVHRGHILHQVDRSLNDLNNTSGIITTNGEYCALDLFTSSSYEAAVVFNLPSLDLYYPINYSIGKETPVIRRPLPYAPLRAPPSPHHI